MVTGWVANTNAIRQAAIGKGIGTDARPPSTRAIALATGVAPSTLARVMNGASPGPALLASLATALGQPVERLFRAVDA